MRALSVVSPTLLLIALGSGGCDGSRAAPPFETATFKNGSRLAGLYVQTAGADPVLFSVYDRAARQHCRFAGAVDGRLRCLPVAPTASHTNTFADDTCRERLYACRDPRGCSDLAVTVARTEGVCARAGSHEVRRLASATGRPRFVRVEGRCVSSADARPLWALGARVAPDNWVEGTNSARPPSAGLSMREVVATDGSRFPVELFDARTNAPCRPSFTDDDGACVPEGAHIPGHIFADAACTTLVAEFHGGTCARPLFIQGTVGAAFAVGARFEGTTFYRDGGGACLPDPGRAPGDEGTGPLRYLIGPPTEIPATARVRRVKQGTGRVVVKWLADEGGRLLTTAASFGAVAGAFDDEPALGPQSGLSHWDEQRQIYCRPLRTRDAGVRCVPVGVQVAPHAFLDETCTVPAARCAGLCPRVVVMLAPDSGLDGPIAVTAYEVAANTLNNGFVRKDEGCRAETDPRLSFAPLGPALSWDGFPPLAASSAADPTHAR